MSNWMRRAGRKVAATPVGDEQKLPRHAAERWTLKEAAAELSKQFHEVMSPADWLAVLKKLVPAELGHPPGGDLQADELNALLDAHPRWKAFGTPRLPSARKSAEDVAGRLDYSMHAAYWFDMAALTPREAAGLLCQSDPLYHKADPANNTNDETSPDDFRLLLRVFSDVERSSPGCRTLMEWLKIAKVRGCKHHSWISKYLAAREQLGFPIDEASGGEIPGADQTPEPERRLTLLRVLGGGAKYARGEWRFAGMAKLVAREKEDGRKRRDEKTIRADLKEAAQDERDAKNAGFADGLGQR